MTTEEKCAQIIKYIVNHCNDPKVIAETDAGGRAGISFSPDHGECSITVDISGKGHSHVGNWWDTATPESFTKLVDELHALLISGRGLSFVSADPAEKVFSEAPVVEAKFCTRKPMHTGPCNGFQRHDCETRIK